MAPLPRLSKVTVLVAEDDDDFREAFVAWLAAEGATVREATNAVEAMAILAEWMPRVIFTDLMMPGGDGRDLLTSVRSREVSRALPVVAMSANGMTAKSARGEGFDAFLPKPIDFGLLVSLLLSLAP
ncbi:MAG: response regulator [Myxococcota bacterium]|nr:response regulator [Myxococcota bacterium]